MQLPTNKSIVIDLWRKVCLLSPITISQRALKVAKFANTISEFCFEIAMTVQPSCSFGLGFFFFYCNAQFILVTEIFRYLENICIMYD